MADDETTEPETGDAATEPATLVTAIVFTGDAEVIPGGAR